MIDLKNFIARPDSFDMRIALVNDVPVCLFRDAFLDKPGAEMVFPGCRTEPTDKSVIFPDME